MNYPLLFGILVLLCDNSFTRSECPNACSSHGSCGLYDMCTCWRNWMGNDCSQRMCQFNLGHVDTPKGDLNDDGIVSGPDVTVVYNSQKWPSGTQEQYPNFVDSNENVLENTAHAYYECSNKGYCDRNTGTCSCFPGYRGSACQRMTCPVDSTGKACGNFGVCKSAANIAAADYRNHYNLWDKEVSFGCVCDAGFYGPICESKTCKVAFDPIYHEERGGRRYSNWSYVIGTDHPRAVIYGNYSIKFFDYNGQVWKTDPIQYNADCAAITSKLEMLPNNVIPFGSVRCLKFEDYGIVEAHKRFPFYEEFPYYGVKYTLTFPGNPGGLRQIEFDTFLDGTRSTLYADRLREYTRDVADDAVPINIYAYADGYTGEYDDYFRSECLNVDITLLRHSGNGTDNYHYFGGLTELETRKLQKCLGDSNGVEGEYSEKGKVVGNEYTWDYGSVEHPHVVKLVDLTIDPITDLCPGRLDSVRGGNVTCIYNESDRSFNLPDQPERRQPPGFIVPLVYDPNDKRFKIFTRPGDDYSIYTQFAVFTTSGVAQLTAPHVAVYNWPNTPHPQTLFTRNSSLRATDPISTPGQLDCETNPSTTNGVIRCVEKNDIVFVVDPYMTELAAKSNPKYLNLYRVENIGRGQKWNVNETTRNRIILNMGTNAEYTYGDQARMYIFTPPLDAYPIVSECANRGICDGMSGLCSCFDGFAGDACQYVPEEVEDEYEMSEEEIAEEYDGETFQNEDVYFRENGEVVTIENGEEETVFIDGVRTMPPPLF